MLSASVLLTENELKMAIRELNKAGTVLHEETVRHRKLNEFIVLSN
jgi:hypothetical protein